MRKRIKTLFILLITASALSGCVPKAAHIRPSYGTARFSGIEYVSLADFCDFYGINYRIDSVSRVAELNHKGNIIKIMPDSRVMLINDSVAKFSPEVEIREGRIYIPPSVTSHIEKEVLKIKARVEKVPPVRKFAVKTIIIDPGHGGSDPGAIGRYYRTKEKDVDLDISKRLGDELRALGFNVILTRDKDKFISLFRRSEIANKSGADLFISVHANANRSRSLKGFEVYYLSASAEDNANRDKSKELAELICGAARENLEVREKSVMSARFYVLKGTLMPAVLVEVGYLSNEEEETRLRDYEYRIRVAGAIARGVLAYNDKLAERKGYTKETDRRLWTKGR